MHATTEARPLIVYQERLEHELELPPAPREASPELFQRVVRKRTHDVAVLGVALLFVSALLALGVWMTMDVADGLAVAQYCGGNCIEARR